MKRLLVYIPAGPSSLFPRKVGRYLPKSMQIWSIYISKRTPKARKPHTKIKKKKIKKKIKIKKKGKKT
jgi:hypothetical protein